MYKGVIGISYDDRFVKGRRKLSCMSKLEKLNEILLRLDDIIEKPLLYSIYPCLLLLLAVS